ncbi:MAG: hypothetical protein EBY55_06695 [Gammaproteobacteria bacterium]|nr:hypothetical protein [Gammaproteobacteria bacterium]
MLKKNPAPAGFFFGDERLVLHIRRAGVFGGVQFAESSRRIEKGSRWIVVLPKIVRVAIEDR